MDILDACIVSKLMRPYPSRNVLDWGRGSGFSAHEESDRGHFSMAATLTGTV